mgnify:CR=1 FL=1
MVLGITPNTMFVYSLMAVADCTAIFFTAVFYFVVHTPLELKMIRLNDKCQLIQKRGKKLCVYIQWLFLYTIQNIRCRNCTLAWKKFSGKQ